MTVRRTSARARHASTRIDEPTLLQFVLLSMLLHILAIVMFGTTIRGGAGRGDEILGTLDVTLRHLAPERGTNLELAPGSSDALRSPSRSLLRRPESSAGPAPKRSEEAPVIPTPAENPQKPAPRTTTPEESFPRLNPSAPEELDKPPRTEMPTQPTAPAMIGPSPPPLEPVVPSRIERELSPPIEAPVRAIPTAPALPIQRVAPAEVERSLAKPVELPQQAIPLAPGSALEPVAPPRSEREIAPPVEPLREQPLVPAAPIERAITPAIEREFSPAIEVPTRTLPAAPSAPIEPIVPPRSERQLAPPAEFAAPRREPAPAERETVRPPGIENVPAAPRTVAPPRERAPSPPDGLPPSRLGAPERDEDIFKPRPDRSVEPGDAPRIDLDAAKKRAVRSMAREGSGSTGVLPFPLPVPPEKKSKGANAMEKAIKPDCRTAYAGLGLLALPALAAAAITGEGCRW